MAYKQKPGRGKSTPLKMASEKMKSTNPIMMKGDLDKDGKMSSYESKRQAAIDKAMADEKSPVKMYGSPVKMEGNKGPLKMYKSPVKMNGGPGDGDDDDKKKEKASIDTSTYMYKGEKGGKLSPSYEKRRKQELLKKAIKLAQERLDKGQMSQSQHDQFVASKKKQYQTFDD